jgi:hypothetical protein
MASTSVSLGDAIQRAALSMQNDLQNTLLMMRSQDPEQRTTELKHFIARNRKKALQLYALTRWMSSPGILQCFRAISDYNGQISVVDQEMARNLDEVYFCHAGIYTMRSRPYEVSSAVDISVEGSYNGLPTSVFSCGRPEFPDLLDASVVKRNLDLCLQAKLQLSGALTARKNVVFTVSGGLLKLTVPKFYCLYLTLSHLSEQALWTVLNCNLLVEAVGTPHSDTVETTNKFPSLVLAQGGLLRSLRAAAACGSPHATDSSTGAAEVDAATGDPLPRTGADTAEWNSGLSTMLDLCEAAALDCSIQVLAHELSLAQATASSFRGVYDAGTRRLSGANSSQPYLSLRLWESIFQRCTITYSETWVLFLFAPTHFLTATKSSLLTFCIIYAVHREHQYEVRMWHPSTVSPTSTSPQAPQAPQSHTLRLAIYTRLTYRHPTLVFADDSRVFPIPGVSEALQVPLATPAPLCYLCANGLVTLLLGH